MGNNCDSAALCVTYTNIKSETTEKRYHRGLFFLRCHIQFETPEIIKIGYDEHFV